MNIICSVCKAEDAEKVVESRMITGARFAGCSRCLELSFEPRPLIVLGSLYGNSTQARRAIKYRLYVGDEITATEIV